MVMNDEYQYGGKIFRYVRFTSHWMLGARDECEVGHKINQGNCAFRLTSTMMSAGLVCIHTCTSCVNLSTGEVRRGCGDVSRASFVYSFVKKKRHGRFLSPVLL